VESLILYFESIPSLHRSIILVGGISFFWLLEGLLPLRRLPYKKWPCSDENNKPPKTAPKH
jgi:hypothetical protein